MKNEKKSIVYLAGAISGVDDYVDKFRFWELAEREKGNIVLNPAKLPEGMSYESYMPICLAMIMAANRVLVLPGSEGSRGVAAEVAFARCIGKPVEYAEEGRKMTNGDRIRAMTDEELATLLDETTEYCNFHCVARPLCSGTKIGEYETCAEFICKWLKQEATE